MEVRLIEDEQLVYSENDVKGWADLPAILGSKWSCDLILTDRRFIVLNRENMMALPQTAARILLAGSPNRMEFPLSDVESYGGRVKKGFFRDRHIFTVHTRMRTRVQLRVALEFRVKDNEKWVAGFRKAVDRDEEGGRGLVRCNYCGSLMMSDSLECPNCGGNR